MARIQVSEGITGSAYVGELFETGIVDIPFSEYRNDIFFLPYGELYARFDAITGNTYYISVYNSMAEYFYVKYSVQNGNVDGELIKLTVQDILLISVPIMYEFSDITRHEEKYGKYRRT